MILNGRKLLRITGETERPLSEAGPGGEKPGPPSGITNSLKLNQRLMQEGL